MNPSSGPGCISCPEGSVTNSKPGNDRFSSFTGNESDYCISMAAVNNSLSDNSSIIAVYAVKTGDNYIFTRIIDVFIIGSRIDQQRVAVLSCIYTGSDSSKVTGTILFDFPQSGIEN